MFDLMEIDETTCKWFGQRLNSIGAAVITAAIQDLKSQDKMVRDDACRYFGITSKGEKLENFSMPFFIGENDKKTFLEKRDQICDAIKNGTLNESIEEIAGLKKQKQQNNNK